MISTSNLHDWIRQIIKKSFGGFASPEDIDRSINSASVDLFNALIKQYRETDKLPDLLRNFKRQAAVSITAGAGTITAKIDLEVISAQVVEEATGNSFDVVIAYDDIKWTSRQLSDIVVDKDNPQEVLTHNMIKEVFTQAQMAAGGDLSEFYIQPIAVKVTLDGDGDYEGILTSSKDFFSTQFLDVKEIKSEGKIKDYFQMKEASFAVSPGNGFKFNLPDDYVQGINIFLVDAQNNYYEGDILDEHEFAERLRSVILTPDLEHPIARIVNHKIEFYPSENGGAEIDYVLAYRAFPTLQRPLFKIEDGKLFMRPALPDVADTVEFIHYRHPVEKRPLLRTLHNGTDTKVEVLPKNDNDIALYYLKQPDLASYGYTLSGDDIAPETIVDLDWDNKAFQSIATQALFYLGYQVKDAEIAQLSVNRDQSESIKSQL
jgi:hypothetical protein